MAASPAGARLPLGCQWDKVRVRVGSTLRGSGWQPADPRVRDKPRADSESCPSLLSIFKFDQSEPPESCERRLPSTYLRRVAPSQARLHMLLDDFSSQASFPASPPVISPSGWTWLTTRISRLPVPCECFEPETAAPASTGTPSLVGSDSDSNPGDAPVPVMPVSLTRWHWAVQRQAWQSRSRRCRGSGILVVA